MAAIFNLFFIHRPASDIKNISHIIKINDLLSVVWEKEPDYELLH